MGTERTEQSPNANRKAGKLNTYRNVNKHKYALLDQVIDLVTEPNALMRVTEIEILEVLVKVVANELID